MPAHGDGILEAPSRQRHTLRAASQNWREGIERLPEKASPAGGNRALETLIDRLLQLNDGFRTDPGGMTS